MRRRTFDILVSATGLFLAVTLIVSGLLLTWAHSFIGNEVRTQLAAQQIVFPANNSPAIKAPEFAAMHQYAGQLMTNGAQAEVYADHFIANHLKIIGGGQTYAQLSGKAIAQPKNLALAGQVEAMFKGTMLRGSLLNAYAFWKMGQLALWGALVAFAGAALLLIMSLLGFAHLRRVSPEAEIFPKMTPTVPATTAKVPVTAATVPAATTNGKVPATTA